MPIPAAYVRSSPIPGGGQAPWPSFRFPDCKDQATAQSVFVLLVGGLMLAIGSVAGVSLHHVLAMVAS